MALTTLNIFIENILGEQWINKVPLNWFLQLTIVWNFERDENAIWIAGITISNIPPSKIISIQI